jgi:hypothetical protein
LSPPRPTEGSLVEGGRPQPRFCSGRLQAGRLLCMSRHKPQHKRRSAISCLSAIFSPATGSFNCPVTAFIRSDPLATRLLGITDNQNTPGISL